MSSDMSDTSPQTAPERAKNTEPSSPKPPIFPTLEAMAKHASDYIEGTFHTLSQDFLQTLIVETPTGLQYLICPWHDDQSREIILRTMMRRLQTEQASKYSFLSEAWMTSYARDDGDFQRPSQHPRRVEVFIIITVSREGQIIAQTREIRINDAGKRCLDEPKPMLGSQDGILTALFKPDPWGEDFDASGVHYLGIDPDTGKVG